MQKTYTHTDEAKKKIGDAKRGRITSIETKQKISAANKGNTHTAEVKQILSDKRKAWWANKKGITQ